jgi:hypothetical protein
MSEKKKISYGNALIIVAFYAITIVIFMTMVVGHKNLHGINAEILDAVTNSKHEDLYLKQQQAKERYFFISYSLAKTAEAMANNPQVMNSESYKAIVANGCGFKAVSDDLWKANIEEGQKSLEPLSKALSCAEDLVNVVTLEQKDG